MGNRVVKFRGKRVDTGEWVYGYPIIVSYKAWIKDINDTTTNPRILGQDFADFRCVEIIPETVGQYTGLKDKNGKDIFEGDIHEYDGRHFDVKFGYYTDDDTHVEMYGWYLDSNSLEEQGSLGVDSEKYVNIIGNIHEKEEQP